MEEQRADISAEMAANREVRFTYDELMEQNRSLTEELTQCRADKDFVWTLWKRLQADKPDISSAVSMVIAREQEKAEIKDKKVLVILKEKDNNIKILEEIAADLEVQLKQSMERLSGLLVERTEWESKIFDLQKSVDKLKEENEYQQEVMKARETQHKIEQNNFVSKIENLEAVKQELEDQANSLVMEVDKLRKENSSVATIMESNKVLKDKIDILEKDLELTKREHKEQITALQSRESQLLAENAIVNDQHEQIEQKEAENVALSSDLKKVKNDYHECLGHIKEQNEIIRNLQLLQDETQQVLRSQQDSHRFEVKSYKATLKELRVKCVELQTSNEKLFGETEVLKQSLDSQRRKGTEKDIEIADLRQSLTHRFEAYDSETQTVDEECNRCRELEQKVEDLKEEIVDMKDIIHERGRRISSLEKILNEKRKKNLALREESAQGYDDEQSDADTIGEKFKSKIGALEKEIEDLDALLTLKDNELQETKKAHNRRLQRYKMLRENYCMVNEQLRTFEQDSTRALNDSIRRAEPKSLMHENSDSVWNELSFFRKQYQILKKEREEFEEEIDILRVKNAEKDVIMKKVELKLHEEEDECLKLRDAMKAKQKFISPSKLHSAESQVEILHSKLKQLERQKEVLSTENEALKQRERYYKEEIINLSDEIDNIHRNIKEKIDAEVQASELMMALEQETNKSLNEIADTITAKVEQYIQTSPSPQRRSISPSRTTRQITQGTQTSNSESDDMTSSNENVLYITNNNNRRNKYGKGKSIRKRDLMLFDDMKTAKERKRQKADNYISPVLGGKIVKTRKLPPMSSPTSREQTSLKVRVLSLQQQVDVLRNSKMKLAQEVQEKKDLIENMTAEFEAAMRKLEMNKISIQRFSEDLERSNQMKEECEKELEKERKRTKAPEIGYKELENRWKLATTESAKLSFQVKTLRGENEMLTGKQKEFQERTVWLERQLNQKKQLLEEFKEKLKESNETCLKDKENLEELKKKNKALSVNVEQRKQYVEDLRNKINEILEEKLALKQKLTDCEEEVKRKSRLLQQSQDLCSHAEKAVSEMEKAAFDQLQEQAIQHEKAQKKIKIDVNNINKQTQEYQWLIKNFVETILRDAHKLRVLISERRRQRREEEKRQRSEKEAMKEARGIACNILDMTSEDLDSFMAEEDDEENLIEVNDNDVREKLEEYLKQETKFSKQLLRLLLQVLDQNWSLKLLEYVEYHQLKDVPLK